MRGSGLLLADRFLLLLLDRLVLGLGGLVVGIRLLLPLLDVVVPAAAGSAHGLRLVADGLRGLLGLVGQASAGRTAARVLCLLLPLLRLRLLLLLRQGAAAGQRQCAAQRDECALHVSLRNDWTNRRI